MRRFLLLAGALPAIAPAALAAPAPRATETVDQIARPSPVSAFGNTAAWSAYDTQARVYRLRARVGRGANLDLPVAPRPVPFDASVGRIVLDGRLRMVIVYSRCAREPKLDLRSLPIWTTARGCDLYRYDFKSNREQKLAGASTDQASEFLPAAGRRTIAFARIYTQRAGRRGELPYVYVRPLDGGRSERLPGGPRGDTGGPGPLSLAVHERGSRGSLAFVWAYQNGSEGRRSAVRVDAYGAGSGRRALEHHVADQGASGRALSTDELLGASYGADGTLYWAETCAGDTAGCNAREWLYRQRPGRGDRDRASAPRYLLGHAFSDRGGAWVVRSRYGLEAQLGNPCIQPDYVGGEQGLCQVERLNQPGYR